MTSWFGSVMSSQTLGPGQGISVSEKYQIKLELGLNPKGPKTKESKNQRVQNPGVQTTNGPKPQGSKNQRSKNQGSLNPRVQNPGVQTPKDPKNQGSKTQGSNSNPQRILKPKGPKLKLLTRTIIHESNKFRILAF